ncbi:MULTISPECIES: histidine phosphatase family protein [Actinomyces]|uniref:Histidine phosphatase family protein n=1 Tax=Actinomyces marmotae TaxID=2737173 RepID=A0A6M8B1W6_9ACTO|nr:MULTISPECIES: histidine phosphatase family protein [Actinomyces]QKD79822.1 histidine phosphatase family protein [Actinomyces marmotae]
MKLILVRHGRTIANVMQALDTGFPGQPLDEIGREQAATIPGRLEDAGLLAGLSSLWVSPILRARQTMEPVERATGLRATILPGLREVLAGDLEMATDGRSVACYADTTRAWMAGRLGARIPGSLEDGLDTITRFDGAVRTIAEHSAHAAPEGGQDERGGGAALLVSHGTVLRLWTALRAALGGGADPLWVAEHPLRNTGITVAEGDPDAGWRLLDWNDGAWRGGAGSA